VAFQERQELEASLASCRDMTAQRQVELTRAAEDSERQLQRERMARSEADAELDRLRGQLRTAEAGRASAQQECSRLQAELVELHAEADRDRKGYDDRLAELTRAAEDSERQLQREQTARSEAHAERERLSGALMKVESERTAAQKDVERLRYQLTEVRNDYEARQAAVDRQLAQREQRAPAKESSLSASQSARRTKSRTRVASARAAIIDSDAAGPAASSIEPAAHGLKLHFKKPADWAEKVFVYYWDTDPATEELQWPGVPLTQENDWFVHWLPQIRSAHLVFNDNAGKQTQNLYRDRSGWLDADGTWHDDKTGHPALADR
jgi:hypothetical protein